MKIASKNNLLRLKFSGLTLAELLLASALISVCIVGLLLVFVNLGMLNELNRNKILAYNSLQAKLEEIKNLDYDCICTSSINCACPGTSSVNNNSTFFLSGFPPGKSQGRVRISYAFNTSRIKNITAFACFQGRRLVGNNVTNCQSSPVYLTTLIADWQ